MTAPAWPSFGWLNRLPVRPWPGVIEIAVVGAHLAGMPLNCKLTAHGATFLRATTTTADYNLFALPGGPPAHPDLLRARGLRANSA
jgi:allophanate hydrolase